MVKEGHNQWSFLLFRVLCSSVVNLNKISDYIPAIGIDDQSEQRHLQDGGGVVLIDQEMSES